MLPSSSFGLLEAGHKSIVHGRGHLSLPPSDVLPEPLSQLGVNLSEVLDSSELEKKKQ